MPFLNVDGSRLRLGKKRRRVRYAIALAIISAVSASAYVWGRYSGQRSDPGAVESDGYIGFDPVEVDLGDQTWNDVVPFQLTLVNHGTAPITVDTVESSCDCAVIDVAEYRGRTVGPGVALAIDVALHTSTNPGLARRRISAKTVGGERYSASVTLNVRGTWSISPDAVDFGDILLDAADSPDAKTVLFESSSDALEAVESAEPWVACGVDVGDGGLTTVNVRVIREQLPFGQNSASVVVHTSSALKPTGVLYVRARGVHELISSPQHVLLVGDEHQRIDFSDRAGQRVRLVAAESGSDALEVQILDDGAIEVWNTTGRPVPESIAVRVTDVAGRSRVLRVAAF